MAMGKSESRRIGILGGTFNPIHFGHLRVAEEVRQSFALEKLYLVPSARPPHKGEAEMVAAEERLMMVRKARRGNPFLGTSACECRRSGMSYSVATIKYFKRRFPHAEIYFVIGWDAWGEIATWRAFPEFFGLADFIVISRSGFAAEDGDLAESLFPFALKGEFCYEKSGCYQHISGHRLHFMAVTRLDISSSMVRREILAGRSLRYLVPDGVANYISEHGLYTK
ncbi:MAG TPA: nicotinate (nicotinamide) nucleotide adenylyltransferase [Desulfarculaceae bacterium]|nr:nicotinate (nicotinamide) nucleotide adenylyltransferase [Desulfarculaceae bacterium]